jgi:hypothetical protein
MAEVFAESTKEEKAPTDHAAGFVSGSMALYTWGVPISNPISAVGNLRRHKGLRAFGVCRGKNSAFTKFMYSSDSDGEDPITPFRFLDLPLEIRRKIYSYLLIHPKPIFVHADWHAVHVNPPQDHTILRVSKKILLESTQFLYEKNIFHAVVNSKLLSRGLNSNPVDGFIKKEFLPYFKNVIVECHFDSVSGRRKYDMIGATANCLMILAMSEALLDSVTLVMRHIILPSAVQQATHSTTLLQLANPMAGKSIPEYFKTPDSKIMRIITKLRCKVLNIVLRLPERRRLVVSINLRGLPVNQDKSDWFADEKVAKLRARKLAHQVETDLLGLKKRYEDIFEDYEKAIVDGKARLMGEDESLADGLKLASRS